MVGRVAQTGDLAVVHDVGSDPYYRAGFDNPASDVSVDGMICVPLTDFGGKVKGVLQCVNKEFGSFDEKDREWLGSLCKQAGTVISTTVLLDDAHSNQAFQGSIIGLARDLSHCASLSSVISRAIERSMKIIHSTSAFVMTVNSSGGEGYQKWEYNEQKKGSPLSVSPIPVLSGIAEHSYKTGDIMKVQDDGGEGGGKRSFICGPLFRSSGQPLGILHLGRAEGSAPFSATEEDVLKVSSCIRKRWVDFS